MRGEGTWGRRAGWVCGALAAALIALVPAHSASATETGARKDASLRQESRCKPGEATTRPAKFVLRNFAIRQDGCLVTFDTTFPHISNPKIVPGIENAVAVAGEDLMEWIPADRIALDQHGIVYRIPHGCVLDKNYEPFCKLTAAQRVDGLPPINFIASYGGAHLAVDRQGQVWGWGENKSGQVGRKTSAPWRIEKPVRLPLPTIMQTVSVRSLYSTGLDSEGRVWFWGGYPEGTNYRGVRFDSVIWTEIPDGKIHQIDKGFRAVEVTGLPPARQILGKRILAQDGSLWTWGVNVLHASKNEKKEVGGTTSYLLVRSRSITRLDGDCNYDLSNSCVIFLEDGRIFNVGSSLSLDDPVFSDDYLEIARSDQTCLGPVCMLLRPYLQHLKDRSFIKQIGQVSRDCDLTLSGDVFSGSYLIP